MAEKSWIKNRWIQIIFTVVVIGALLAGIYYVIAENRGEEASINEEENNENNEPLKTEKKIVKNERTFPLGQYGHINSERDRLKVTFGPSYYHPTGLYVEEGDEIRITVNDHDQFNHPRLIISPPVLTKTEDAIEEGFRVEPGTKDMPIFRDGIIYLVNHSQESEVAPEVTIKGANILPTFTLGETTIEEWEDLLEEHKDAPAFELVSDLVTITAGMDYVDLVTDPEQLLVKHDEAVEIQARASGLDADDPDPVHHPTKYRYHYRHSGDGDFWMYAWFNHTGYHTDALRDLLSHETFVTNGWGPWHELGHVHQQGATTPGIFGEVTNNVFSMTVQREFEQSSRLEDDNTYNNAFRYLEESADAYEELDVWVLLVSLWQLDLAYGEDLYPEVYRMVRETDGNDLPNNDEDKLQKFVYWTSISAEENLIPFFERWGLEIADETREEIEALHLPELRAPIWWNRDSNHTIKPRDVSIASIYELLEAYEAEITSDQSDQIKADLEAVEGVETDEEEFSDIREEILTYLDGEKSSDRLSEKMHEILSSQIEMLGSSE